MWTYVDAVCGCYEDCKYQKSTLKELETLKKTVAHREHFLISSDDYSTLTGMFTSLNNYATALGLQTTTLTVYGPMCRAYYRPTELNDLNRYNIIERCQDTLAVLYYRPTHSSEAAGRSEIPDLSVVHTSISTILDHVRDQALVFVDKYNNKKGLIGEPYVIYRLIGLILPTKPTAVRSLIGLCNQTYVLIGHTSIKAAKKRALHSHLITYANDYVLYGHLSDEQKQRVMGYPDEAITHRL